MTRIQLRRGTAAQWTSVNPVLASGEMGIETDTNKFKFGDGTTAWNSLDYVITGEVITDYTELDNLPSINNITLTGNKSASDLGLQEGLINGTGILISGTTISVDDSVVAMRSDIPDVSNFVTNSSLSTTLQDYQPVLESGTNIKTINNLSLLGSGNIEIQSGGTYSEGTGINISNGVISVDTNTVALKSDLNNLVTVSGNNQQIVGNKIFEGGLQVDTITSISDNSIPLIHYGSQGIEIGDVSIPLNFYGSNARPQYMDGINYTLSDLALTSDIPSLTGYATETWVQNQNYLTSSALTNYVTTNTAQNISGRKTFLGEKAIYFKQQAASNKLGFTLYNPSNTELGALEWRPNTIGSASLLTLNCPQTTGGYVGFRYWGNPAVNIVAPKVATAGNYFIPTHITDGNTTVTASNTGTVNISTLLPDLSGYATQNWVTSQGYTSNVGTVTSVNNTQPDSNGNVSITIPDNTTFMDLSTNQTAYGTKTFNDLRVHQYIRNVAGKVIFYGVGSSFSIGNTTCELTLDGSTTRPHYYNGTTNSEMALLSDIPIVPTTDQTYNSASTNPQSGTAVEEAINTVKRNIGELVYSSLPLTDAGLHLLDGALISGSGSYSAFVDYIADLHTANPNANYFTDETTWQNTVTQYGVCGKFVYDSTNNTVRLPKITGIVEGTTDITALGDLVEAGLPNIKAGAITVSDWGGQETQTTGAWKLKWTGSTNLNGGSSATEYCISFDASSSSSIYGNSSTVQPQTIKCFVYIVIATSTKTDIQVDIDEIATDLNGKADTDLSNTTDQAKILMSGMAMPSDTYINLTLGASGTQYTAPASGWVYFNKDNGAAGNWIMLLHNDCLLYDTTANSGNATSVILPIKKGNTFQAHYSLNNHSNVRFRFYYAQGSESEAN